MEGFKGKILENLAEKNSECFLTYSHDFTLKVYHLHKIEFVDISHNLQIVFQTYQILKMCVMNKVYKDEIYIEIT